MSNVQHVTSAKQKIAVVLHKKKVMQSIRNASLLSSTSDLECALVHMSLWPLQHGAHQLLVDLGLIFPLFPVLEEPFQNVGVVL